MRTSSKGLRIMASLIFSLVIIPVLIPPVSASPGIDVYKGAFQKITTTGDQTVSEVGFTPKAVIFWWTRQTAFGESSAVHAGYGFATYYSEAYQNRGVAFASDDAAGTSNAGRMRSETYCIVILDSGSPAVGSRASVTEFTSDGFTLNWETSEARADYIHFVALGGTDITDAKAGTFTLSNSAGDQEITEVGFQPDFLMFLWTFTEAEDTGTPNGEIGMGFAKSSTSRGASVVVSRDGRGSADTFRQQRTDSCILLLTTAGAQDAIVDFVSMDSDGFTVTKSDPPAANTPIFYLAMAGGRYAVGDFQSPTSAGNQDITTVGFQPRLVMLATQGRASSTARGSTSEIAFGAATSSTARGCTWFEDPDARDPTDNEMETLDTKVVQWRDRTAADTFTLRGSADFSQFLSDGFQLNWSDFETAGREVIYVAFGDGAITYTRTAEGSFSFSGLTTRYLDADRTMAASLVLDLAVGEVSSFGRTIAQAMTVGFILLGTSGFFRSTTLSMATALQTSGIANLVRSMSLYVSTLFQSDRQAAFARSNALTTMAAFSSFRRAMLVRSADLAEALGFSASMLLTLVRQLHLPITTALDALREAACSRLADHVSVLLLSVSRSTSMSRVVSGTMMAVLEAVRAQTLERQLTLVATFQAAIGYMQREVGLVVTGAFTAIYERASAAIEELTSLQAALAIATAFDAIQQRLVVRDATMSIPTIFEAIRESYLQRRSTQAVIAEFANTWTKTVPPPSVLEFIVLALGFALVLAFIALIRGPRSWALDR